MPALQEHIEFSAMEPAFASPIHYIYHQIRVARHVIPPVTLVLALTVKVVAPAAVHLEITEPSYQQTIHALA